MVPIVTKPRYAVSMANDDARRLGQRIKALRGDLRLTQAELARRAFVSRSYIAWLETGRNMPSFEVLGHVADALGVTRDALIAEEPLPQPVESTAVRILEDLVEGVQGVPIRYIGTVPADVLRWAEWEEGSMRTIPVPLAWMGSRSKEDLFIVEASGDCLMRRGIIHGTQVLCERAYGRMPRDRQIVVVRVGDEVTMKVWRIVEDRVELHDGDGNVIARLDTLDDVVVVGFYVKSWLDDELGSA